MKKTITGCKTFLLAAALMLCSTVSFGHGGVSVDDDVCVIRVGPYKAHFTGYQPEKRATQEFCEDIPVVGKAIFVLDFISDDLRVMDTDFRIIKDVNNIGNQATFADLGSEEDIEKATIYYNEPKKFPRGTINVRFEFPTEGRYIGLVSATHPDSGRKYTSVFPFQVGVTSYAKFLVPIGLIIVFSSIAFGIFLSRVKSQEKKAESDNAVA
ncbi:MAG: hypothetical protein COB04_13335 [Gammaproteobacteria bacterium]|nr:MAG: hypothetical protein COB04_13335 [Gammaproteobacteria bacterium]